MTSTGPELRWTRLEYLAIALCCAALAGLVLNVLPFAADDAFISLRYARHLAEGHGLRWNPGEDPVEGYSNFLHVLLGAGAITLGWPPFLLLRALNVGASLCSVVLVHGFLRKLTGQRSAAALGALMMGLHGPLAYWAVSGLETGLYVLCTLAAVRLAVFPGRFGQATSAVCFLLASLLRPEGPVFFGITLLALWIRSIAQCGSLLEGSRELWRQHRLWILLFLVPYAVYFLWRVSYFGYVLPNSAVYKSEAGPHRSKMLWSFLTHNLPAVLLLLLFPLRRAGFACGLAVGQLVTQGLVFYNVMPAVTQFDRFLLPALPWLVILASSALAERCATLASPWLRRACMLSGGALLAAWSLLNPFYNPEILRRHVWFMTQTNRSCTLAADYLSARLDEEALLGIGDVGIIGYLLPNPILDTYGLNSGEFTRKLGRNRKTYAQSVMQQRPEALLLISTSKDSFVPWHIADWALTQLPEFNSSYPIWAVVPTQERLHVNWLFFLAEQPHRRPHILPPLYQEPVEDLPAFIESMRLRLEERQRLARP